MEFLKLIAQWRNPFLDGLMSIITMFGEESLFIAVALAIFWCVDKRRGYYLLFIGFIGTVINQFLKMVFRIPRPWIQDPEFKIVESAREQATGYSFPSGHTSVATTLYGGLAVSAKRWFMRVIGIVLVLLIAFSRMYLGVHTPLDVITSLAIGAVLALVFYPVICWAYNRPYAMFALVIGVSALAFANLVFMHTFPFPADVDVANLDHALENAWKLVGLSIAMCFVYPIDTYLVKFDTRAVWWAQILKLVLGFGIVMAIRILLKQPLNALLGELVGGAVRYFLMVIVAGCIIPIFFRFLPKENSPEEAHSVEERKIRRRFWFTFSVGHRVTKFK